jgi:hypothetical protein
MKKEFVTYELSLELKQLGFDKPCFGVYFNSTQELFIGKKVNQYTEDVRTSAPTYSQAFRWFREKHGLNSHIHQEKRNNYSYCCGQGYSDEIDGYQDFDTYEEAEFACLKKLIEIVQGGNK